MLYTVTAPTEGFTGEIGGVAFHQGAATADDRTHRAALAYFRRRGYTIEPASAVADEPDEDIQPRKSASKAAWVEYAVAHGMTAAEAEQLTRDQLVERFADEGEDQ